MLSVSSCGYLTSFRRYTMVMVVVTMIVAMDVAMVSYYDKFMWLVWHWIVAELYLFDVEEVHQIVGRSNLPLFSSRQKWS